MTTNDFRRIALKLPGASESSHMGHPDFRINGKIFATLHYPDENWGMVKLPLEHQDNFVQTQPEVFVPVRGAWGRQGSTSVRLKAVDGGTLEQALRLAWSKAGETRRRTGPVRKRAKSRSEG
jgi:hypothetical protein